MSGVCVCVRVCACVRVCVCACVCVCFLPSPLLIAHPPPLCSTLSSVEPPNVWLDLKLPPDVISEGKLSALQLEAVVYSCQQHMNILGNSDRAGYLVGMCTFLRKERRNCT